MKPYYTQKILSCEILRRNTEETPVFFFSFWKNNSFEYNKIYGKTAQNNDKYLLL